MFEAYLLKKSEVWLCRMTSPSFHLHSGTYCFISSTTPCVMSLASFAFSLLMYHGVMLPLWNVCCVVSYSLRYTISSQYFWINTRAIHYYQIIDIWMHINTCYHLYFFLNIVMWFYFIVHKWHLSAIHTCSIHWCNMPLFLILCIDSQIYLTVEQWIQFHFVIKWICLFIIQSWVEEE